MSQYFFQEIREFDMHWGWPLSEPHQTIDRLVLESFIAEVPEALIQVFWEKHGFRGWHLKIALPTSNTHVPTSNTHVVGFGQLSSTPNTFHHQISPNMVDSPVISIPSFAKFGPVNHKSPSTKHPQITWMRFVRKNIRLDTL